MKFKRICFFILLQLGAGYLFAQDVPEQLTLNQLLDSALENNYLLQSNEKNNLIKQAEIEILKTNYQPKIITSANFSYWKFLLPNKERLLSGNLTDMYTDISFYQTIYDWGENKERKSVVQDEILLNDEVKRQIQNTIIWGVTDVYFELLKAKSEIAAHENALNQLKWHLQYTENLYNIGKVSSVDVLKINVQISVEEKNLQKARGELYSQKIKIKRLCYLNDNAEINVENNADALFTIKNDLAQNIDSLYHSVIQNHPLLIASDHKISMETKQKEIFKLQSSPELYSYGIGTWEHGYIPFNDNFNYNIGIGIRYTLPFWGGGSYKLRIMQSNYKIEQLSDEKSQTLLDLKKEIDLTNNSLDDIRNEINNNKKIIDLSNETLNNAFVKYQVGQGPIIDVLDAQTILTESVIAYDKLKITYLQALAKLHYLTGNDNYPF